jgi:hypothetical protein
MRPIEMAIVVCGGRCGDAGLLLPVFPKTILQESYISLGVELFGIKSATTY